ncbi:hypothetical protein GCM10023079_43470 [Streptomyces chitinivorans]
MVDTAVDTAVAGDVAVAAGAAGVAEAADAIHPYGGCSSTGRTSDLLGPRWYGKQTKVSKKPVGVAHSVIR